MAEFQGLVPRISPDNLPSSSHCLKAAAYFIHGMHVSNQERTEAFPLCAYIAECIMNTLFKRVRFCIPSMCTCRMKLAICSV